jgi:hypothetical protein
MHHLLIFVFQFSFSCYVDRSLKSSVEWCEFCRCPKCGDKSSLLKEDDSFRRRTARHGSVAHLLNKKSVLGTVAVYLGILLVCYY